MVNPCLSQVLWDAINRLPIVDMWKENLRRRQTSSLLLSLAVSTTFNLQLTEEFGNKEHQIIRWTAQKTLKFFFADDAFE